MSDQDTIFNTEPTQTQPATEAVTTQEPSPTSNYADLLATITSEDGRQKYQDVETALKSLPHANDHISTLQREIDSLKEEVSKRASAEEVLQRLESRTTETVEQPSSNTVDLAQLERLVDTRLSAKARQEVETANTSVVKTSLGELYGDKAEEVFYANAQSLGLSREQVNKMAATSPAAVLKLMGVDGKPSGMLAKTSSDVNTEVMVNGSPQRPSAKVSLGASSKDMVSAWNNARPTE